MTIEQDIENYLKHYEAYGNEPLCLISPLRSMYPWLCHQQSIIKNQAEEIERLKKLIPQPKRKCMACNGSGRYDSKGSPPCGACDGTGEVE